MDDVVVVFEYVYFFNGLDGLDIEFFEGSLEFFVIIGGVGRCMFDFFLGSIFVIICYRYMLELSLLLLLLLLIEWKNLYLNIFC